MAMALAIFVTASLTGQSNNFWNKIDEKTIKKDQRERSIVPSKYEVQNLDLESLRDYLKAAPKEDFTSNEPGLEIQIPLENDSYATFELFDSPVMEEGLASRYPRIKSYKGIDKNNPLNSVRISVTPRGFHAAIHMLNKVVYIDCLLYTSDAADD